MLGAWCNWYFEETSLLSPDAFSCLSGSDYRVDTRFGVDTETGCVCTHSQTHGNNYSVWGIGSSVFVSLCLSLCLYGLLRWYCVSDKSSDSQADCCFESLELFFCPLLNSFFAFSCIWRKYKTKVVWLTRFLFCLCKEQGFMAHFSASFLFIVFCLRGEIMALTLGCWVLAVRANEKSFKCNHSWLDIQYAINTKAMKWYWIICFVVILISLLDPWQWIAIVVDCQ